MSFARLHSPRRIAGFQPARANTEGGALLAYLFLLTVLAIAIASVSAYVAQTSRTAHRRSDMISAIQFAQGGATVACADLNTSYINSSNPFPYNLTNASYTLNTAYSTNGLKVYERTISSPFTNQSVFARIWLTNGASANTAKIIATCTVGKVTQTSTVNLRMAFAFGSTILSVNQGTSASGVSKANGQAGNVDVSSGGGTAYVIIDGNSGLAINANGTVAIDATAKVPAGSVSSTNWGTANQITDFTSQGTANALFDFNRFIAVSDLTSNAITSAYNTNSHNNHFTNVDNFANAMRVATNHTLEGVITVDIRQNDKNWQKAGDAGTFPNGINIHGTLFYNFGPEFGPLDKFIADAALNINAANVSSLVFTNPATYTTGYPPVYLNTNCNPINVDITSKGFLNFVSIDDLPALAYSIGEVDMHGPANVCGVCYTPSYMEIENKGPAGTLQYFKGMIIMGNGIYIENTQAGSASIYSFDRNSINNLTTAGNTARSVIVAYWQ